MNCEKELEALHHAEKTRDEFRKKHFGGMVRDLSANGDAELFVVAPETLQRAADLEAAEAEARRRYEECRETG